MRTLTRSVPGPTGIAAAFALLVSLSLFARSADKDVVINELMYHPPFDMEELQYIELFNRGTSPVDLSHWSFTKGINFEFPEGSVIPAGSYLVVCRNTNVFSANYGRDIPVAGNFAGRLSHKGEKIELCNSAGKTIDELRYSDHMPWPAAPDGHSSSLERISPAEPSKTPANWSSSTLPPLEKLGGTPGRRNDSFSEKVPPGVANIAFKTPRPMEQATVTADIEDAHGLKGASLFWHTARSQGETAEQEIVMQRIAGDVNTGTYQGIIPGQPEGTIVRFRIRAANLDGATGVTPGANEPKPTFSYSTFSNTNSARIPFVYALNISQPKRDSRVKVWNRRDYVVPSSPTRGNGAFVYVPPDGGEVLTFDHVLIRQRKGGYKVHFGKQQPFHEMTGINIIFESSSRWVLSEPLAYDLYHLADTPAPLAEHVRLWMDGQLHGYQLLLEQPTKGFLTRNHRDDTGYMYKATWMGQGLTGQHEKKTRPATGYDDLRWLHARLRSDSGAAQWDFIQKHFNVEEFASYYAVNMCIQNWDGFFNNHWLYHDAAKTGKWEIYPWDEDKTWGDYDGASPNFDWYTMPLTFGMSERGVDSPEGGFGYFGGRQWQRPPGWFSGPLLANQDFRRVFLARLHTLCDSVFTEDKLLPYIDSMEKRLEPEIPIRARLTGWDANAALAEFHHQIQTLRNQVKFRRKFILEQIPKDWASK